MHDAEAFQGVLAALDLRGLESYHCAIYRAVDAFLAVAEMPRASRVEHLLDEDIERLYQRANAIAAEVERRVGVGRDAFTADEWRSATIVRFRQAERLCGDTLQQLVGALGREGLPPAESTTGDRP